MDIRSVSRQFGDTQVGSLVGVDKSIFLIMGDGCAEMKRWLEDQTVNLLWVCLANAGDVQTIFVAFPLRGVSDEEVRAVNDAYMLFKMSWMPREDVQWQDQHHTRCKLQNWRHG